MSRKPLELTLAFSPEGEPEIVHKLYPHVGDDGRKVDITLLTYFDKIANEDRNEAELLAMFSSEDSEFKQMVSLALDCPYDAEPISQLTFPELVSAFMEAMRFRARMNRTPEVEAAIKKSLGDGEVQN